MKKIVTSLALLLCIVSSPAVAKKNPRNKADKGDIIQQNVNPNDPKKLNVKVYPNPSSGGFNVTLTTENKRIKVEILDITGKRIQAVPVFTENGQTLFRIDLTDYPDGIYLLQLESEGEVRTVQLIKKQNY